MSGKLPPVAGASTAAAQPLGQDSKLGLDPSGETSKGEKQMQRAFKFGQVDQNLLMSRLYSTPFKLPAAAPNQQYTLDMTMTSIHKPRIKKIEQPAPHPEPIVMKTKTYLLFFFFIV